MIKLKKIGIITYWWSQENYGQILQMYALQEYLKAVGCDPFLIKYDPNKDATINKKRNILDRLQNLFHFKAIKRFIKCQITNKKNIKERINHPRQFDEFRNKYTTETERVYYSINDLRLNPPVADVYITGSDVVWGSFRPAYYLDFGSPYTKRIAYAPSFGRNSIPDDECRQIKPLLEKFNLVTVRESQGVDICLKAGRNDAIWVLDPTLLLTREHYLQISEKVDYPNKFCFLYLLGSETEFSIKKIYDIAKFKKLDVVYSTSERFDKYKKIYPTINQWLGYYDKADIIITNSFHGCVFSIIFNKNFIFLPLTGEYKKLNVRVQSLLSELNLLTRIYNNNIEELFDINIDYGAVNQILEKKVDIIDNVLRKELDY